MNVTLEEARTLDAIVRQGSFAKAALYLRKSHSAVMYSIKSLELQTGLVLLDRTQYRTSLTPVGKRVWEQCKKLLSSEFEFETLCKDLASGWEPYLKIVVDGLVPFEFTLRTFEALKKVKAPTKFKLYEEFLGGVENSFIENKADIMISVIPPESRSLESIRLNSIVSHLVVHKDHPIGQGRRVFSSSQLHEYSFLTVRGSDTRLNLPTVMFDESSAFHLNNFQSKKAAILKGLGFGWVPEYLIQNELANKTLKIVRWEKNSSHTYFPTLYCHSKKHLGRAGKAFLDAYLAQASSK